MGQLTVMAKSDSTKQATETRSLVLPGTARLGIVRAYFDVYAVLGGVATVGMVVAALWPAAGWRVIPEGHPLLAITAGSLFTWGAVQTSRSLRKRDRFGAWAAALTFAATLALAGSHTSTLAATGLSVVGLGLVASVWRYLD